MKIQQKSGRRAFTLVELLVVVTIIVVLLAMLLPAMNKALYQAALVQCSGQLKVMAGTVIQYAFDQRRYYPYRGVAEQNPEGAGDFFLNPMQVVNPRRNYDVRRPLRGYITDFNRMFQDPLTPDRVEIDDPPPDVVVEGSYMMMWGWQYHIRGTRGEGMFRIGERFSTAGDPGAPPGGRQYSLLIGDMDLLYPVVGGQYGAQASHPDRNPHQMIPDTWDEHLEFAGRWNFSRWSRGARFRGALDTNFAYDDGAVLRMDGVVGWGNRASTAEAAFVDERVDRIPLEFDGVRLTNNLHDRFHVPRK